jgi:hypothetical protein
MSTYTTDASINPSDDNSRGGPSDAASESLKRTAEEMETPTREEFVQSYSLWYQTVMTKWTTDIYNHRRGRGLSPDMSAAQDTAAARADAELEKSVRAKCQVLGWPATGVTSLIADIKRAAGRS